MIGQNLRGSTSESKFCQKFPQLSIIYFQGSQACTSKGVETVFQKAIKSNQQFNEKKKEKPELGNVENCVLFDEIGLAQKSIHNPLKVLHSKLETNKKEICFIGISNWQLDAAKMSRFLVLSRSNPQRQQLQDTAVKILQSFIGLQAHKYEDEFKQMSDCYYEFIKQWDEQNKDIYREGFFGLRDFYSYIKYVAQELQKGSTQPLQNLIQKAICVNFDGQQGSIQKFLNKYGRFTELNQQKAIDPIQITRQNLKKTNSRSLLYIVRGDALLPIIKDNLQIKGQKQRIQCLYGSTFQFDQQSQQYNLEVTSIILSHMSRGTILTFKNPNNSIQTSLYDVFNKSFTYSGGNKQIGSQQSEAKKYCRVAVGANSNPKCFVHKNFGSIVFMDEDVIQSTDLAFLNRFQKHFLTLSNVISTYEQDIVSQIKSWLNQLLAFKSKTQYKKHQHYIINCSEQSIVTLVLKNKKKSRQDTIKNIKKALLKNATQHFHIALNLTTKNFISEGKKDQIYKLLEQIKKEDIRANDKDQGQNLDLIEDKIIFTYDNGIYSAQKYKFCTDHTKKIRISEIKSQKQLRTSLKSSFLSQQVDCIHILIDFQKQFQHVNFVSYLLTGMKAQLKSNKNVFIIIRLSQISLDNAGREHLNISHLLNFEQRFVDTLTTQKTFIELIGKKPLKQIYIEQGLQQFIDNYYYQGQKRFRLMQNDKDIPKNISMKQLNYFTFTRMMTMNQNKAFRSKMLEFIAQNLTSEPFDLSIILCNKQYRNICSNPQQTFQKYLQNNIINLICCFFDRTYRNGLFLCFDFEMIVEFYKKFFQTDIIQSFYERNKTNYQFLLQNLLNQYVISKQIPINNYKKNISSNPIEIKSIFFLPMAVRQIQFISDTNSESLLKNSEKILSLAMNHQNESLEQSQILIQKCISILNKRSVFLKSALASSVNFNFQRFLNQKAQLQFFYFLDIISKMYSQFIDHQNTSIQKVVTVFIKKFKKIGIKQKVLFLTLSRQIWSNIFNLWGLWLKYNQQIKDLSFIRQMQKFFTQSFTIQLQAIQGANIPILFRQFCSITLSFQQNLFQLKMKNIQKYGISKYLEFFVKTYYYYQKIRISCDDLNISTSRKLRSTKRLFNLFDSIFAKQNQQTQIARFLSLKQESDSDQFEYLVENYLKRNIILFIDNQKGKTIIQQIKNQKVSNSSIKGNKQLILNYLCLDIYSVWIQRLMNEQQTMTMNKITKELKYCLQTFIQYSNNYCSFANNAFFFLQTIFQEFQNLAAQIEENIIKQQADYLLKSQNQIIRLINQKIQYHQNFAVAVGNFFMIKFKQTFQEKQQAEQEKMNQQQPYNVRYLKENYEVFCQFTRLPPVPNKLYEIYILQFKKFYCQQYLKVFYQDLNPQITSRIDGVLKEQNQRSQYLRIFLFKKLLNSQKQLAKIKTNYLDKHRCKWLQHFQGLIESKKVELLIPPPSTEETLKIMALIKQFRQKQYAGNQQFEEIVFESFSSPYSKYQFLNFLACDIYTCLCSQQKLTEFEAIIDNNQNYKNNNNIIQYRLIKCYLKHKINNNIQYQQPNITQSDKKIQYFVFNQLIYINFINVIVSCSKIQCPLIQMFFNLEGQLPQNYQNWIQDRFLLNGRQNLVVSLLDGFIQRNDASPGYYKCSAQCDMYYSIGGNGYGCQYPNKQGNCVWCKKIIGGVGHQLTRLNEGARRVMPDKFAQEREIARQKKILPILNTKLNGYSYNFTKQEIIKQIEDNNRSPYSLRFVLQEIICSIWGFLASIEMFKPTEIQAIFKINSNQFHIRSFDIAVEFNKKILQKINSNQEQNNIIWHLAIGKQIMKFIINYKQNLSEQMKSKMGLIRCIGRDNFEKQLSQLIIPFSNGKQKLQFINKNRFIKAGQTQEGLQIFRETGGYEMHLEPYPKIRLIKLIDERKSPDFKNLMDQYGEIIYKRYPILSQYSKKQEQFQRLNSFRKIYAFCTKIIKLFNLKISRQQAQKKSIVKLFEELNANLLNQEQKVNNNLVDTFKQQVRTFCQIWNQLRNLKYDLAYGCHTLGKMNQVTEQLNINSPAINFFPDNKYRGDQKGEMLLSLLQVSAQQYNLICYEMDQVKMSSKKYRQIQIFNKKEIYPTQVHELTKTMTLDREIIYDEIRNFSSWSVQYGCSLPHYSIDKIESIILEKIVGSNIFSQSVKEYDSINFIGQQLSFISQIRESNNQKSWQLAPKKEQIQKFIYTLRNNAPDQFLKQIITIKGSLQLILHYYTLKREQQSQKQTIQQFIVKNKIKIVSKQFQAHDLFSSLEMKFILGFYQFIQLYTLQNQIECMDLSYKRDKLTDTENKQLDSFKESVSRVFDEKEDILYLLSLAIYRFVARSLSLVEIKQTMILRDYLYEGADLWPHNFEVDKLMQIPHFNQAFGVTLTKMGSLIEKMPLNMKKTKDELLQQDQKKQNQNKQVKKEPEKIIKKKRKNN